MQEQTSKNLPELAGAELESSEPDSYDFEFGEEDESMLMS